MMIPGNNICLRDWMVADLASYLQWNLHGNAWQVLDGPYYPRPTEKEQQQMVQALSRQCENNDFPHPRTSMVIASMTDNILMGQVNWYWQGKETNWVSIGIVIYDPSQWGKGIGYEALSLWMDYLFATMPEIVRLDMRTWSGNMGMMKLAEKLGFQLEARFRKARIVEGVYYDSMGYGILREEWE
jgi:RimJ/RimL family protein N-acetyltransferase